MKKRRMAVCVVLATLIILLAAEGGEIPELTLPHTAAGRSAGAEGVRIAGGSNRSPAIAAGAIVCRNVAGTNRVL
jgi:hypothetical protein